MALAERNSLVPDVGSVFVIAEDADAGQEIVREILGELGGQAKLIAKSPEAPEEKLLVRAVEGCEQARESLASSGWLRDRKASMQGGRTLLSVSEVNQLLCGHLRDELVLPGLSLQWAARFRDKLHMKRFLADRGIAVPAFSPAWNFPPSRDRWEDNALLKPRLGFAARGIQRWDASAGWPADAMRDDYMLEEYVAGTKYHCDALLVDGELRYCFFSEYLHEPLDHGDMTSAGSILLGREREEPELATFANRIFELLPADCVIPVHLDIYRRPDGKLVAGEMACRPAGNRIRGMIRAGAGIDILASAVRAQAGLPFRMPATGFASHAAWGAIRCGNICFHAELDGSDVPPGIMQIRTSIGELGRPRGPIRGASDHLLSFIAVGDARDVVLARHANGVAWARSRIATCSNAL